MIRVYLFRGPTETDGAAAYLNAWSVFRKKWSGIKVGLEDDNYVIWLEFESEEEAALFKLTEL